MNYIVNDNTKVIFLKKNELLIGNQKGNYKLKVSEEEFNNLKSIYENKSKIEDFSKDFINKMLKNKIIVEISNIASKYIGTRYEKFEIFLKNNFDDRNDYIKQFNSKKILFVGAGGICSEMINQFIAVGIKQYVLIDFDVVNVSNLNRQFVYNEKDIGNYKVDVLKKYILSKDGTCKVEVFKKSINNEETLNNILKDTNPSIIVCSADNPIYSIQKWIIQSCIKYNTPCIFGGVGQKEGSYGPLLTNKISMKKQINYIDKILDRVDKIYPCNGSFGITNSLVGIKMAQDVIYYLMNKKSMVKTYNKSISIKF